MKIIKVLNYIFPIIIGAICSSMGTWLNIGISNTIQIILILFFSIIFSILLYYEGKKQIESIQTLPDNSFEIKFMIMKNIILQLFAIVIGTFCSSLGDWNRKQDAFRIKIIIIIVLALAYLCFVVISVIIEEKVNQHNKVMLDKIQQINQIYDDVIQSIQKINYFMYQELSMIKTKKYIDFNCIERISIMLCSELRNIISQYDNGDLCITFSKKIDKMFVQMIAFASNFNFIPNEYSKIRDIKKDIYMDSKIIESNVAEIVFCRNQEEVDKIFPYFSKDDKRCQKYFAIPVWIENETQGVFQVIYYSESTFLDDTETIKFFVSRILLQYTSITMLINMLYELMLDK